MLLQENLTLNLETLEIDDKAFIIKRNAKPDIKYVAFDYSTENEFVAFDYSVENWYGKRYFYTALFDEEGYVGDKDIGISIVDTNLRRKKANIAVTAFFSQIKNDSVDEHTEYKIVNTKKIKAQSQILCDG